METQFLTVRLNDAESALVARLHQATGESKSSLVKRALKQLAEQEIGAKGQSLFALGAPSFGKHGDSSRQSADLKSLVKQRVHAKRTRR